MSMCTISLQLIQVKMNNFNDYVCDLLQLLDIFCVPTELAHNLKEPLLNYVEIHPKSTKSL